MTVTLTNPLTVSGQIYNSVKVGVFDVESDRLADAHILRPLGKRVLQLWRGDAYTANTEWTSADVVARVNALNESGELAACFDA